MKLLDLFVITAGTYQPETLNFDPATAANEADKTGALKLSPFTTLNLGQADPVTMAIALINIVLTFLAAGFLTVLIYAGFLWVTAHGNEEQITKAKELIKNSGVGLLIILAANGIAYMLFIFIQGQYF
ncbi:MAG: hypothetical protein WCW27_00120 [Patescibacteria group bacterium]|jgi:hypothetical protein